MADNSDTSGKEQRASARRRGPGRPFQPGQSGNPGGRPKGIVQKVKELIGEDGADMLAILDQIARGTLVVTLPSGDTVTPTIKDRREAAIALLERGFGRPSQPLSGDAEGGAINVIIQKLVQEG